MCAREKSTKKIFFVLGFTLCLMAVIGSVSAPPPKLTLVSPNSGTQGQSISGMDVYGSNFNSDATVSFSGTGITVTSVSFIDSGHLQIDITIAWSAGLGARDVTVTNPPGGGGNTGTGTGLFTVYESLIVPEFPLGAALQIALIPLIIYVWLKRRK